MFTHKIPLHIDPSDHSSKADLRRLDHWQQMAAMTGGKGFRQPSKYRGVKTRTEKLAARFMEVA